MVTGPTIGGGITGQGNISRLLQDGINAVIEDNLKDYQSQWPDHLDEHGSKKAFEEDLPYARFGLAKQKLEGAGIEYDSEQTGPVKRYTHTVYALGTIITEEAIEDNLYMKMMVKAGKALGKSVRHTEDQVAANVINNGYSTEVTWDALSVFNDSHILLKGGTYSNVLPTAADLSETAIEDAIIAIRDWRDHANLLVDLTVKSLHIPPELEFVAERILGSYLQNNTANNAINALMSRKSVPDGFYMNRRFEDPNNWFLKTDAEDGGKFFRRRNVTMGQDNDFGTSNYRHKAAVRFAVGVGDARHYFGSGEVP